MADKRKKEEQTGETALIEQLTVRIRETGVDVQAILDDIGTRFHWLDVGVVADGLEERLGDENHKRFDDLIEELRKQKQREQNGEEAERRKIDYSNRHRNLEWRDTWFHLARTRHDDQLRRIRDRAIDIKRKRIDQQRDTADHMAGYAPAPAGAGTPWFSIGPRNVNGRVKSLAVHPTNKDIVYAGTASGGVWKSTDGAESWEPLWDTEDSLAVGSVEVASTAPDTVYAGTGEWTPGYGPSYPGAGVYVSTDGGNTWTQRANVNADRIARVLVSPTDVDTVYVAGNAGFERSTDGGNTWTTLRTGQASDAVIDPDDANTIYVAIRYDGIYKTTDGGATWNKLTNGPTGSNADWLRLAIGDSGASGSDFLLAKRNGTIYRTTDGGATWTTLSGSHGSAGHHPWANLIAVAPDDEDVILAGGVGAERTADGGASWSGLSGLHADHHRAVFAPSDPDVVYECNDGGVYRSTDKGSTWEKTSDGLVVTQFYDIGSWDPISTVAGGGTQDQGTNMTTGGLTWTNILGNDGGYFVVNPNDPRTIYAEYQNTGIQKSTDGGNSWTNKTSGLSGSTPWTGVLTMDPNDPDTLFTGTNRVFRTTDGIATNWSASSQTLAGQVSSIEVAPSDSNRVYAGTGDKVWQSGTGKIYRSDDNGATSPWTDKTTSTLPSSRPLGDIDIDGSNADRVVICYAGTSAGGSANHVFESTDGGDSWTDISGDLPNMSVSAVALDPNDDDTIYVGTDVGVFRTTNGGSDWLAFDNGIPNVLIADLHIDPEDETLYAATFGRGMYKLNIAPGGSEPQVDLYLRDSLLDTGERDPSPSGQPNPNDPSDNVYWWESPDIKVDTAPFDTPDAVFDGVEFDIEVIHEDPQRTETNRFYLQVHNRGWEETSDVKVRAFFADASAGLPPLPTDFWSAFPDTDPSDMSVWKPIGPAKTVSTLEPNRPEIVSWDWTVPLGAATHSCLLAVVTSADDPITTTELNVDQLVNSEKRVGLKNLHVVNSAGPRPTQTLTPLKFYNTVPEDDAFDIVIEPIEFDGGTIGLLLEPVGFIDAEEALQGVQRYDLREDEDVGDWYVRPGDSTDDETAERQRELWERLDTSVVYEFDPTKRAELRGIEIGAGESVQGLITVKGGHNVPYDRSQQFAVMQRQRDAIVGGSTYEVRLTRAADLHPVSRIRVVLERVRILEDSEPWFRGKGEFAFTTIVAFDEECRRHYTRIPRTGHYEIGDDPGENEQELDVCIFDGYVAEEDDMSISVLPVEQDWPDSDDESTLYSRRFHSPPESWVGQYVPGDERAEEDLESTPDWELYYRIESLPL
jgi:photosystem II stability/assembly factor-like uncharacterized protein